MKIATFNVRSGGFSDYGEAEAAPPRLSGIRAAVAAVNADIIGLTDTFRWPELYDDDEMSRLFDLGYTTAFQARIGDDRVDQKIAIAFLSRFPAQCSSIRLGPRNAIKALIGQTDQAAAVVYVVYLDDLSESKRLAQVEALVQDAQKHDGLPVVIVGDFNAVRPQTLLAWCRPFFRVLRQVGPLKSRYMVQALGEMSYARVIPAMRKAGFGDGAPFGRRASCFNGPIGLGLDYIWTRQCQMTGFKRWNTDASDHRPISVLVDAFPRG